MSSMPLNRQCKYPGCFRTSTASIHGKKWSCSRCAEDGGHVYWNSYLSVNRYKDRITEHHEWLDPVKPVSYIKEIITLFGPIDGVTFDD